MSSGKADLSYEKESLLSIKPHGQTSHGDWKITIRPELARQMTTRSIEKLQRSTEFFNQPVDASTVDIKQIAWNEDPDVLSMGPWKRFAFVSLVFTALLPGVLSFITARKNISSLHERWDNGTVPTAWVIQVWSINILQVLLGLPASLTIPVALKKLFWKWRPRLRLLGAHNLPSVDVLIPTCGEPLDVVKDTVRAALALDYPLHRFRVIVTDDGRDPELRDWVASKNCRYLHYTSRPKKGCSGYKAGNLNHAIKFSETLSGGPGEYVAGLDADMIPEKGWLRAVLPHLLLDPQVGVACPPQHFYNAPANDPLLQTNPISGRYGDYLRDMGGWAWNSGSGWVSPRDAVESIGGFPTTSLTEDVYSSTLMAAKGWKSVYIPEALQYGLMPDTFTAHIKQYTRWNLGGSQMAILMDFYLPRRANRLTFLQRLLGISTGLKAIFTPTFALLSLVVDALSLAFGVPATSITDKQTLILLLRLQCVSVLMGWLYKIHMGLFVGYQFCTKELGSVTYMDPYYSLTSIRAFLLPKALGGKMAAFVPTGSLTNSIHERNARRRAPLLTRIHHIIVHNGVWFHCLIAIGFPLIASYRAFRVVQSHRLFGTYEAAFTLDGAPATMWMDLLRTVAWPTPSWVLTHLSMMIPLWYTVSPPTVPDRDDLLTEPDIDGARYPKQEFRDTQYNFWTELRSSQLYHATLLYASFVFVASWWM